MSHEIDMSNDRANVAFINEAPWHKLGSKLTPGAPLEVWAKEGGMLWQAVKRGLTFKADGKTHKVPDRSALTRADTNAVLGIVSTKSYHPVQPQQVIEFYRDLTEKFGFEMEVAGCLFGGKRVWALANTKNATQLKGDDISKLYLLLSTSYDCSGATTARLTSVRVVCNNTLELAQNSKNYVSVYHSAKFDEKAADRVKQELQIGTVWDEYCKAAEAMQNRQLSKTETADYLAKVYDIGPKTTDLCRERFLARMQEALFNSPGAHMASARGTLWGALQAVTYDVDHHVGRANPDNHMHGSMMGSDAARKRKAYEMALALAA